MEKMPERDWKRLRSMQDAALDALCARHLAAARRIIDGAGDGKAHAALVSLWKALDEANETVGRCFDDLRRSTAIISLLMWRRNGLLPDERLGEFSDDTQNRVRSLEDLR